MGWDQAPLTPPLFNLGVDPRRAEELRPSGAKKFDAVCCHGAAFTMCFQKESHVRHMLQAVAGGLLCEEPTAFSSCGHLPLPRHRCPTRHPRAVWGARCAPRRKAGSSPWARVAADASSPAQESIVSNAGEAPLSEENSARP